jgi:hypothetical protein
MDSLMQNLVIDIGDVTDKGDVIAALGKPATQDIEIYARANMADMRRSLHSCTTEIDPNFSSLEWNEGRGGSRQGVI